MSTLDDIGTYIFMALICFVVSFFVAWGIVGSWVGFWEYGEFYNALTLPAWTVWIILARNLVTILVMSGVFGVIAFILTALSVAS